MSFDFNHLYFDAYNMTPKLAIQAKIDNKSLIILFLCSLELIELEAQHSIFM